MNYGHQINHHLSHLNNESSMNHQPTRSPCSPLAAATTLSGLGLPFWTVPLVLLGYVPWRGRSSGSTGWVFWLILVFDAGE